MTTVRLTEAAMNKTAKLGKVKPRTDVKMNVITCMAGDGDSVDQIEPLL